MGYTSKATRRKWYAKNRVTLLEYKRLKRLANPDFFREKTKLALRKWRQANALRAQELNRKHQATWRTKNPEVNRLRARDGMRKAYKLRRNLCHQTLSL